MRSVFTLLVILLTLSFTRTAYGQVDKGGFPRSFQSQHLKGSLPAVVEVSPPDLLSIQKEDIEDARLEKSYRVGVEIPVAISLETSGQWDQLPGGGRIWRVAINSPGAQGIGLNFKNLQLPPGSDLFVYTPDHSLVIGAITSSEIPSNHTFTSRPLYGDKIIIEYYQPESVVGNEVIEISGLVFMYRGMVQPAVKNNKSTLSGSCEVNVNCEEGQNWQNQKQGVVKIYAKVSTNYFWCTGTLINNTEQNFSGLLLTAAHCSKNGSGVTASVDDFSQWVFYFNYETAACGSTGAQEHTIIGVQKLAMANYQLDVGSDFLLLKLQGEIPASYNPFYCGWNATSENSTSGVCIHHPGGDVKKISTYTTPLSSGTWGSTPNTHWVVKWAATNNGFGVTEGGSSGSPLFNNNGLVIGALTGGDSDCQHLTEADMFGKVYYSWLSNGNTADQQLKPWLDPGNSGTTVLPGSYNEKYAVAEFSANSKVIPVGGTVDFQDLSRGKPDHWHWYFQGANPSESTVQNPSGVRFERFGKMNVKLVVSNSFNSDTIVKEEYIDVRAVVSPNPSFGVVNILTDLNNEKDIVIEVFDAFGKIVQRFGYPGAITSTYSIKLPPYGNVFFIRVMHGDQVQTHKVIVVH